MSETHPYIPNSAPSIKAEMLHEIGVRDVETFFDDIPESIRKNSALNLHDSVSEMVARLQVEDLLFRNV